jgi:hypothetical protein
MATDVDNIINAATNPVKAVLITAGTVTSELGFNISKRTNSWDSVDSRSIPCKHPDKSLGIFGDHRTLFEPC